ncbi:DHH family phosphoesterase [Natrarchaeobaculum aegyptiacum]|uniref:DHH family phosphoesterase n=1 Tax=Natrarchaeobaculum aegyptiacum TaxID=745377 RepID=A0A2Z2HVP7_9EURY|nr:bifunctional oligoribonuclease/PAP phosphatase NrnA [Natrarchaeobaculum aegyptiacum]ARS91369.1 DHH family phosphoesterase [Natrarchaeobaculum aegyptiacum]
MRRRLVLGWGSVSRRVVDGLADRGLAERLLVVTDDESAVKTLRDESVPARAADPADPATLETVDDPAMVFVGSDRTDVTRTALENARRQFPRASIVTTLGGNPTPADRERFAELADHVVDDRAITDAVLEETLGRSTDSALALRAHLRSLEGPLAVVMHDNPDPDAIASAVALVDLAESVGLEAEACYSGEISHQENRAMVNLLDLDLRNLGPEDSLTEFSSFALVDHSRPGVNDGLPEELQVDVVIDHHPPRGPVPGTFVELRDHVGATSTILTEYVHRLDVEFDVATATALLYGIRIDTDDFTREVSREDFQAASILLEHADVDVLERIEQPTIDGDTLETIARAIKNREQRGSVAAVSVGRIGSRDALPQAADQLLAMEGVDTTLVFGFRDEMAYLSARSRADDVDLGETLRDAFDRIGSAGGHADMAGAQLEVGILGEVDDDEEVDSILSVVEEVITNRFFEAIRSRPGASVGAYSGTSQRLFTDGDD